ncbi:MAG: hypothetical protein NW241_23465 [Bacteroidia bacterium]|nr:hypothetical protein [Bacteroidia bacterium]
MMLQTRTFSSLLLAILVMICAQPAAAQWEIGAEAAVSASMQAVRPGIPGLEPLPVFQAGMHVSRRLAPSIAAESGLLFVGRGAAGYRPVLDPVYLAQFWYAEAPLGLRIEAGRWYWRGGAAAAWFAGGREVVERSTARTVTAGSVWVAEGMPRLGLSTWSGIGRVSRISCRTRLRTELLGSYHLRDRYLNLGLRLALARSI